MRIDPRAPWANPATRTNGVDRPELTRFALIGAGWRSRIFTDLARALPDQFALTGVLVRRGSGSGPAHPSSPTSRSC